MGVALKVVIALLAGLGALFLALVSFVALIYAFSSEMPRDQVAPTAVAGVAFAALALALLSLAVWLMVSVFKASGR